MWIEQLPNGKYRYCERFKNPHTGKVKKERQGKYVC